MAPEDNGGGGRDQGRTALKAAGVAAASSAAVLAARAAMAKRSRRNASVGDTLGAGLEAAWGAAREVILPTLEEGAAAAGRFVAERAPEPIRESLLPRFLDAFHEARERLEGDAAEAVRDRQREGTGGGR